VDGCACVRVNSSWRCIAVSKSDLRCWSFSLNTDSLRCARLDGDIFIYKAAIRAREQRCMFDVNAVIVTCALLFHITKKGTTVCHVVASNCWQSCKTCICCMPTNTCMYILGLCAVDRLHADSRTCSLCTGVV